MTKKQIYLLLTITFMFLAVLALHYESLFAGIGAIVLFTTLYEDRKCFEKDCKEPKKTEKPETPKKEGFEVNSRNAIDVFNGVEILIEKEIKEREKKNCKQASINNTEMNDELQLYITEHAFSRLEKRFKCDKNKQRKIARKAWRSKSELSPVLLERVKLSPDASKEDIYRYYMGFIFIFKVKKTVGGAEKKILVTLYNPNHVDKT